MTFNELMAILDTQLNAMNEDYFYRLTLDSREHSYNFKLQIVNLENYKDELVLGLCNLTKDWAVIEAWIKSKE